MMDQSLLKQTMSQGKINLLIVAGILILHCTNINAQSSSFEGLWRLEGTIIDSVRCPPKKKLNPEIPLEIKAMEEETITNFLFGFDDLYIKGDTAWLIKYPCVAYPGIFYTIKSDSLFNRDGSASAKIRLVNNQLQRVSDSCTTTTYTRATYKKHTLDVMARYGFNPSCFLGTYKLITHFTPEYPYYDQTYDLVPPIRMPSVISLLKYSKTIGLIKSRSISLTIGNKERVFHVSQIAQCNYDMECSNYFLLTPGDWWDGEEFVMQYRSK
jgi:hypothetical protein